MPTERRGAARDTPDRRLLFLGAGLIVAVAVAQLWLNRGLEILPSPIFGGDYSYQMGCIESIRASGNPLASCSVSGALPGYLPLYGTLVALLSRAGGLDVVPCMLALSVLFRALSTALAFWVFARLYGRGPGLALACLWSLLNPDPIFKYTEFTLAVIVPLYFYALFRFVERPALPGAAGLGLTLAAAGYSHAVVFVGGIAITVLASALALAAGGEDRARRVRATALGLVVAALGACLALGYWYRPVFVHHGASSAHYTEWNGGVSLATLAERVAYAGRFLLSAVRIDEWPLALRNLLSMAGLLLLVRAGGRRRFLPGVWIAAATFLYVFHYFVTMPLFHTHVVPDYVRRYLWVFAAWFLAAIPVVLWFDRVKSRAGTFALASAILAATVPVLAIETRALDADPAMAGARLPRDPALAALQAWVKANTRPDDVALSANEPSFAWAALTGRKTVVTRRAQNDPFVDMDVRNRDAALMLYGRDEEARVRLLAQYRVRYLLWMEQWTSSEYRVDPKLGTAYVDPLLYFRNEEYDRELTRAGVKLIHHFGWVDPALRGPEYARFELTLIAPENYRSPERPWCEALDAHLTRVWSHSEGGREVAALYSVRP